MSCTDKITVSPYTTGASTSAEDDGFGAAYAQIAGVAITVDTTQSGTIFIAKIRSPKGRGGLSFLSLKTLRYNRLWAQILSAMTRYAKSKGLRLYSQKITYRSGGGGLGIVGAGARGASPIPRYRHIRR
jgi:hypothetical protein